MSFKYKFDCGSKTSFYVNHDNNVVDTYFNEIRRYPVLSEEEEYQLFMQLKNGTTVLLRLGLMKLSNGGRTLKHHYKRKSKLSDSGS